MATPRGSLLNLALGGGLIAGGGVAGASLANRHLPGMQGTIQNTAGDIAEGLVETESIAAGQNGNIDSWMAGLNSVQGMAGWLSGISALLFKVFKWEGFKDFANTTAEFRAEEQARIQTEGLKMGQTSLTNPGYSPVVDGLGEQGAPGAPGAGTDPQAPGAGDQSALLGAGVTLASVAAGVGIVQGVKAGAGAIKNSFSRPPNTGGTGNTPANPHVTSQLGADTPAPATETSQLSAEEVEKQRIHAEAESHFTSQAASPDAPNTSAPDADAKSTGHGRKGLAMSLVTGAAVGGSAWGLSSLFGSQAAHAEEFPADPAPVEVAPPTIEAAHYAATPSTVEFNLGEEFAHKAHVAAHGVQEGLLGLVAAPEDLWDMADNATGGWLWGDEKANGTYDATAGFANQHAIQAPEIRDAFDAAVHGGAQLATMLIPVGGVLKAAGAGAKVANGVTRAEQAQDALFYNDIGHGMVNKFLMP